MEHLNPIDKSVREAVSAYLSAHPEAFGGFGKHRLTAIGGLQPTSTSPIAHGVGWMQGEFMGDFLAPEILSGINQELIWREFGDDALVAGNDLVAFNGPVRLVDVDQQLHKEVVLTHALGVPIDIAEARIAAAGGSNLVESKAETPKAGVELGREVAAAAFFKSTGNYDSASHYEVLSGTDQFDHDDSDPIKKIRQYMSVVENACGKRPNRVGFGSDAMEALAWNKKLLDLLKQANTLGNGIPVVAQVIALLVGAEVAVSGAIYKAAPGAPTLKVWGDNVFMVYAGKTSGEPKLGDPKFAMTAASPSFPKIIHMVSQKGFEGGQEIRFGDCYKTYACWKKAGAALFDVASA
jgi:hypothetical protein